MLMLITGQVRRDRLGSKGGSILDDANVHLLDASLTKFCLLQGINVFDPKFNIVSPGADQGLYFPYDQKEKRLTKLHGDIENLLFGQDESPDFAKGMLEDRKKPIIFSMARLDRYLLHPADFDVLASWF